MKTSILLFLILLPLVSSAADEEIDTAGFCLGIPIYLNSHEIRQEGVKCSYSNRAEIDDLYSFYNDFFAKKGWTQNWIKENREIPQSIFLKYTKKQQHVWITLAVSEMDSEKTIVKIEKGDLLSVAKERLNNVLDGYKKTRVKFISTDLEKVEEPFKSYAQNVEAQLQAVMHEIIEKNLSYSFDAQIQLHINQNGHVSKARVLKTTLNAEDKVRLQGWLQALGPYEKFSEEMISSNYVTIVFSRSIRYIKNAS